MSMWSFGALNTRAEALSWMSLADPPSSQSQAILWALELGGCQN